MCASLAESSSSIIRLGRGASIAADWSWNLTEALLFSFWICSLRGEAIQRLMRASAAMPACLLLLLVPVDIGLVDAFKGFLDARPQGRLSTIVFS